MGIYTSSYLKNLSRNKKGRFINESKSAYAKFDIFLCHSYLDKEEVEGLYEELTSMGFTVYVDWIIDPQLDRNNVTKENAELVRSRMKASKSLLLAVSANANLSTWIPWELGFVDARTNKCAIIPVAQDNSSTLTFKRFEYLLLYPYVSQGMVSYFKEIFVMESINTYTTLIDWLKLDTIPTYKFANIKEI